MHVRPWPIGGIFCHSFIFHTDVSAIHTSLSNNQWCHFPFAIHDYFYDFPKMFIYRNPCELVSFPKWWMVSFLFFFLNPSSSFITVILYTISCPIGLCKNVTSLDKLNPWTTGNTWACTQHCSYWWPGAKAPGHQYQQCWQNIHCIRPVALRTVTFIGNISRKWNYALNKNTQLCKS